MFHNDHIKGDPQVISMYHQWKNRFEFIYFDLVITENPARESC